MDGRRRKKFPSNILQILQIVVLSLTLSLLLTEAAVVVSGNDTDINGVGGEFEAAFQGKCGPSSPCVQLCVELHDGTFECQCRPGFRLLLDGYSCVEIGNNTYPDEEDDEDEDEDDEDDEDSSDEDFDGKKGSGPLRQAKGEATPKPVSTESSTTLEGVRPLPQALASSSLQIRKVKVPKASAANNLIAARAEAQEKDAYLKRFSPVDEGDPNFPSLDYFGLEPKVVAKETARSNVISPEDDNDKGLKGQEGEESSEEEEDDSSFSSESEEDDSSSTNEAAEEDLEDEEPKAKGKGRALKDTTGGGERSSSEEEGEDDGFIPPPRVLPLKQPKFPQIPTNSFTPSQVKAEMEGRGPPLLLPSGPFISETPTPDSSSSTPSSSPSTPTEEQREPTSSSSKDPEKSPDVSDCPLKCNKGSCTKEPSEEVGYRCLCPMGTKGAFCEVDEVFEEGGGYNSGLFRGKSWTAFPVLHDAYMSDQISLEFRPQSQNGIILLTGERDDLSGDYLALFLKDGYLEFRFDCGSGSGSVRSSTPVNLEQWNKASIIRRRWEGWMQLNDGPFTQGRSKGLFSRITFRQPVYIGGQGNITFTSVSSTQSSSFDYEPELSSMNSQVQIQPRSESGGGSSAATPTISGPSSHITSSTSTSTSWNEPTMQQQETGESKDASSSEGGSSDANDTQPILEKIGGFQGCIRNLVINDRPYRFGLEPAGDNIQGVDVENCNDQAVCDLVKCQHGGQCIVQKDQVQCLCPLGFSGQMCETPLDLQIPSFNGSSYLKYGGLGLTRVLSWLEVEVVIKPDAMDGLILYNGYKTDGVGDFISLIIDQGYIEFAMDLGTGAAIIRSDYPIALGEWHHIHISRTSRLVSLRIDNQPPLMAMTPGAFTQLSLPHSLFLGGIPDPEWLSPKVKVQGGFTGCIQKLVINEKPLRIMGSAMSGVNLENCQHPCLRNPCDHGGDCVPQLDTFKCHCPLGYRDPFCQTKMDKEDVITAPKFIGDSYLRFTYPRIIKRLSGWHLNLSFRLKTESSRGLLLWAGRKWMTSASDFITMGLRNGLVIASFSLGSGQTTIAYNFTAVNDGRWHKVVLIRNEQEASLSVDEGPPVSGVAPGKLRQLNINDGLYIGGVEESRHHSVNRYNEGFVGCLADLVLGSERVALLQDASEGRNVDYCD